MNNELNEGATPDLNEVVDSDSVLDLFTTSTPSQITMNVTNEVSQYLPSSNSTIFSFLSASFVELVHFTMTNLNNVGAVMDTEDLVRATQSTVQSMIEFLSVIQGDGISDFTYEVKAYV
ncbi:hypothetical protein Lalb_Chr09g0323271 [Lupinus albus]|uniref:Uncharacterized protein n=1 Tax=Lupinus albus TaxID=3870 RepID=A0A6A4PZU9_LUPAL|nr:hypothetical protein Lalb_Chr09g0323271 [Lupinus albus]